MKRWSLDAPLSLSFWRGAAREARTVLRNDAHEHAVRQVGVTLSRLPGVVGSGVHVPVGLALATGSMELRAAAQGEALLGTGLGNIRAWSTGFGQGLRIRRTLRDF